MASWEDTNITGLRLSWRSVLGSGDFNEMQEHVALDGSTSIDILIEDLEDSTMYTFRIQSVTTSGLGQTAQVEIMTAILPPPSPSYITVSYT